MRELSTHLRMYVSLHPFVPFMYSELSGMVNRISNVLLRHGVVKNDIVGIYMPVSPLAVAAMLACARIGAIHNVIFAGFSAEAIASRLQVQLRRKRREYRW